MAQNYKDRLAYFEKHKIYFECDGDPGAQTHYLAGTQSPRFTTFHDLTKVIMHLIKFNIIPTFENICRAADKLNIYSF